jgi:hypothetical protein
VDAVHSIDIVKEELCRICPLGSSPERTFPRFHDAAPLNHHERLPMDSTTCPPPADPVNATDGQPESLPPVVGTTDDASNGDGTIAVQDDADLQTAGIALEEPGAKLEAAEPNEAKPVEGPGPPPDGGYVCSNENVPKSERPLRPALRLPGLGDRPVVLSDASVYFW